MPIAGEVAIIGAATTAFGVHHERGYLDLLSEAAFGAVADAGVELERIESAWLGTAEPGLTGLVGDAGTAVAESIGFAPRPVTRVANFCCTGLETVRAAALDVAAGEHTLVLAVGAEKMRDVPSRGSLVARTANLTHPTLAKGRTAPGQFALLANRYMERWGVERETLARVSVKNHAHAVLNPHAHYRRPVTVEEVLAAPLIAEPFGTLDCTPTTDGAAAVVVAPVEWARVHAERFVVIRGFGLAVTGGYYTTFFDTDNDFLGFRSTREAAAAAYRQAAITDPRRELDLVECHDCFTVTELVNYEDLGLCGRGEGGTLLKSGATERGGDIPVNVSGGLQSCGHPIGATGVRMLAELTDHLLGRAGERQVEGARIGAAHTLGGPGVVSCVAVLASPI
jgi:acetyl-CoA C-acetyltransferase